MIIKNMQINSNYLTRSEAENSNIAATKGALNDLSARLTSILRSPAVNDQAKNELQKVNIL